ncbi:hypothetical protein TNCV_2343041 [Trichonephila clavipes]|nr:hypothetical protein TNCV_2343041 [Trichonephila clavipes]
MLEGNVLNSVVTNACVLGCGVILGYVVKSWLKSDAAMESIEGSTKESSEEEEGILKSKDTPYARGKEKLWRAIVTVMLGYRKLCARWVPKLLTEEHKKKRMDFALNFLTCYAEAGD